MSISPSDLFLSPDLTEERARQYIQTFGFRDPVGADEHLQALADDLPAREVMGKLAEPLFAALQRTPDPDAALVGFSRYVVERAPKTAFLRYLSEDVNALGLLVEVMGTSPFLGEILIRNPEYFDWLVSQIDRTPPGAFALAEEADGLLQRAESTTHRDALKRFKRREMLRIASRDILGLETLESATNQISDLADVVAEHALRIATRSVCSSSGADGLPGLFTIVGMGKLGGRELNYSSDIDLLYVYELDDEQDRAAHELCQKLARKLTAVMTEFTNEGYLYRVDLRLRPMGRQGNIAYSLPQCGLYYETWGETFERFALIKARPIAGDRALGRRFLDLVQPFVYRKYLDHAALEEIFQYKLRAERARDDAARNVKVGRGGIREIELFTQVLQVTYGAQHPELRRANTLAALAALESAGLIAPDVHDELRRAYVFLRTVEHRLQIVHDQQTHTLSREQRELDICARRLGLKDGVALEAELDAHRSRVHEIYLTIFERRPGTSDFKSRQFFRILTEEASASEAMSLLVEQHIPEPSAALEAIRALDEATSSAPARSAARNMLANLLATLMERLGRCARPDQVLIRLAQVTDRTGAAASLFRTLLENDALRNLLVSTLDLGDLLASRLIRYPELLDSLLFALPALDELRMRYIDRLSRIGDQRRHDELRRFKAIEEFKILVEWLTTGSLGMLQQRLSLLADCCVMQVATWHAPAVGRDGEPDWGILALGKLGGCELTVHSDLDLVIVYRGEPGDSRTFLERQGFVEAIERCLAEPTGEGIAYRIDTRLRPEGKKGALAIPFAQFERYLATRAEIWERLAWTRWRFLTGSRDLAADVEACVRRFVYGVWDRRIPRYMTEVRRRMERELTDPRGGQLEFKVGRGGLADIDFALQMIQIVEGHARPEFRVAGTRQLLEHLPATTLLLETEIDELRRAYTFLSSLETFARMDADTHVNALPADPITLGAIGRRLLLPPQRAGMRVGGLAESAEQTLVDTYRHVTTRVRAIYEAVLTRLEDPTLG